jgi:inner membrane protein
MIKDKSIKQEESFMNFKTHVIGGIGAGVLANELLLPHVTTSGEPASQILMSSIFMAGSVIGSMIPDIDHRGSFIGRRAKLISIPVSLLATHRGITHSPLFLMAVVSALLFVSNTFLDGMSTWIFSYMSIGFGVGIASHIFLDSLTKGGVPLLYPFSGKKFSFLPLKTGGMLESVIAVCMVIATLLFVSGKYFV